MDGPPQHKYVSIHGYGAFPGVSGRFASVQMTDLENIVFLDVLFLKKKDIIEELSEVAL